MQERLNEEIRRRERVIRIFPNDESALRLIGALLAEYNENWQERRYLDMDEFAEWAAAARRRRRWQQRCCPRRLKTIRHPTNQRNLQQILDLTGRLPWGQIEAALAPGLARQNRRAERRQAATCPGRRWRSPVLVSVPPVDRAC